MEFVRLVVRVKEDGGIRMKANGDMWYTQHRFFLNARPFTVIYLKKEDSYWSKLGYLRSEYGIGPKLQLIIKIKKKITK